MVNTGISGTSVIPAYRQAGVIGLPRCGESYRQADWQRKEVTGAILTNGNKYSSCHSFLTHGAPLAYEVRISK